MTSPCEDRPRPLVGWSSPPRSCRSVLLPRARRSHQRDELARRDRQRDTAQGVDAWLAERVRLREVACLEDGRGTAGGGEVVGRQVRRAAGRLGCGSGAVSAIRPEERRAGSKETIESGRVPARRGAVDASGSPGNRPVTPPTGRLEPGRAPGRRRSRAGGGVGLRWAWAWASASALRCRRRRAGAGVGNAVAAGVAAGVAVGRGVGRGVGFGVRSRGRSWRRLRGGSRRRLRRRGSGVPVAVGVSVGAGVGVGGGRRRRRRLGLGLGCRLRGRLGVGFGVAVLPHLSANRTVHIFLPSRSPLYAPTADHVPGLAQDVRPVARRVHEHVVDRPPSPRRPGTCSSRCSRPRPCSSSPRRRSSRRRCRSPGSSG